ncbi:MAG: hypothetical protein II656_02375, partial [Ruminococcus sp.]|nr:hypothetical protein [Ruminococcus sp.]
MPIGKDEALLLLILGDGTVAEQISSNRYEEMTDTEAIQIPKGHGRIGDLDELQTNVIKAMTYGDALHEIKKAPVILESEVMPDE